MHCAFSSSDYHTNFKFSLFLFNDTATTEIYTLSLHDALPIWRARGPGRAQRRDPLHAAAAARLLRQRAQPDRKSTRLNSSHVSISYAVFCLKKKNSIMINRTIIILNIMTNEISIKYQVLLLLK